MSASKKVQRNPTKQTIQNVWVKYFTMPPNIPPGLNVRLSNIGQAEAIFRYSYIKPNLLRMNTLAMADVKVYNDYLVQAFKLNSEFDFNTAINAIEVVYSDLQITPEIREYIHTATLRIMILLSFQLPNALQSIGQNKIEAFKKIIYLIKVLATSQVKIFEDFITIIPGFLETFQNEWERYSDENRKEYVSIWFEGISTISSLLRAESANSIAACFTYVSSSLTQIIFEYGPEENIFDSEMVKLYLSVLNQIRFISPMIDETGKSQLEIIVLRSLIIIDHILPKNKVLAFELSITLFELNQYSSTKDGIAESWDIPINIAFNQLYDKMPNYSDAKMEFKPFKQLYQMSESNFKANEPNLLDYNYSFSFGQIFNKLISCFITIPLDRMPDFILLYRGKYSEFINHDEIIRRTFKAVLIEIILKSKYFDITEDDLLFLFSYNDDISSNDMEYLMILNYLLFNIFKNNIHSRRILYKAVSQTLVISNNSINCFMPFFNSLLLERESNQFYTSFMENNSQIIDKIINISKNNIYVFDFLRHLIFLDIGNSLCNPIFVSFLMINFSDPIRHDSILLILATALAGKFSDEIKTNIIFTCSTIIEKSIKDHDASSIVLINAMSSCFGAFDKQLTAAIHKSTSFFSIIAKYAVSVPKTFNDIIDFITSICTSNNEILNRLMKNDSPFYNIVFSKINEIESDNKTWKSLYNNMLCSRITSVNARRYIRNFKAIALLLQFATTSDKEIEILSNIQPLTENPSNVFEMHMANTPLMIFKRLPEIQKDDQKRNLYLSIFCSISSVMITNNIFYRVIDLLKNPKFEYPHELLLKVNQTLEETKTNIPTSYFHFDRFGSGILGPKICLGDCFTVCASIRLDGQKQNDMMPLFYFQVGPQEYFTVHVNGSHLWFKNSNKFDNQFDYDFDIDQWHFITITFNVKAVTLYVNGIKQAELKKCLPIYPQNAPISINIATREDNPKSLTCDISQIFIFKSNEISQILPKMKRYELPAQLNQNLLCCYNPSNTMNGFCLNVAEEFDKVVFRGRAIPYMSTMHDVLPSTGAASNLIPLFLRLSGCEKCRNSHDIENTDFFCSNCGAVSLKNGKRFLKAFFSLLKNMLDSLQLQLIFENTTAFSVIGTFMTKMNPRYFTPKILAIHALGLYDMLKVSPVLAKQMIDGIWLNFNLSMKLDEEMQKIFMHIINQAYEISPEPFKNILNFEYLIYKTASFYPENSPSSRSCWDTIIGIFVSNLTKTSLNAIFMMLYITDTDFVTINLLKIIKRVIKSNKRGIAFDCLKGSYLPIINLFQKDNCSIQKHVLKIMDLLYGAEQNGVFNGSIASAIIQSISLIKITGNNDFGLTLMKSFIIEGQIDKSEYLPLISYVIIKSKHEIGKQMYDQMSISIHKYMERAIDLLTVKMWPYWLLSAALSVNDITTCLGEISSPILDLLEDDLSSGNLKEFVKVLEACDLLAKPMKANFDDFKKVIIMNMITINSANQSEIIKQKCIEAISPILFNFVFARGETIQHKIVKFTDHMNLIKDCGILPTEFPILELHNKIRIFQNMWMDQSMIEIYISFVASCNNFQMKINNECTYDISVVIAFMLTYFIQLSFEKFNEITSQYLLMIMEKSSQENQEIAASIIVKALRAAGKLEEFALKDKLVKLVHSDLDTKLDITNQISNTSHEINQLMEDYTKHLINYILKNIGFGEYYGLDKELSKEFNIVKNISPEIFSLYINPAESERKEYIQMFQSEMSSRQKLFYTFMKELETGAGPWGKNSSNLKFKAINRIGRKGKRILMVINHRFDDHKKASQARDRGISTELPRQNSRFKIMKQKEERQTHSLWGSEATLLTPSTSYQGRINLYNDTIEFNGKSKINGRQNFNNNIKSLSIPLDIITFIMNRNKQHLDIACEIFTLSTHSYYFIFATGARENFYETLSHIHVPPLRFQSAKYDFFMDMRNACSSIYQNVPSIQIFPRLKIKGMWINHQITNYEYIYYLNLLGNRSFNDLSQYPIFPMLIQDTKSDEIDLDDGKIYRDMSSPPGALNKSFLEEQKEKLSGIEGTEDYGTIISLYQTLPSSAAVVYNTLVRVEPFTTLHIFLQSNKFDVASRIFYSINYEWKMILNNGFIREAMPEYFSFSDFLTNANHFDLGKRAKENNSGMKDQDEVVLPRWAKDRYQYIFINRIALECNYASETLNQWLDLYFGPYRKDLEHNNFYCAYAYPELPIDPKDISPEMFGTMPVQVYENEHQARGLLTTTQTKKENFFTQHIIHDIKKEFISFSSSSLRDARGQKQRDINVRAAGSLLTASRSLGLVVYGTCLDNYLSIINVETNSVQHISITSGIIMCSSIIGSQFLLMGCSDCSVRVIKLPELDTIFISSFQTDSIIAINGNAECGLVASIDQQFHLVFEALFENKFIRVLQLEQESYLPKITVFKSGIVVVAQKNSITYFDAHGEVIERYVVNTPIASIDKYYDNDTHEFLIFGIERTSKSNAIIEVIDLATFQSIKTFKIDHHNPKISICKGVPSIIVGSSNMVTYLDFGDAISRVIRNDEPNLNDSFVSAYSSDISENMTPRREVEFNPLQNIPNVVNQVKGVFRNVFKRT